VVRIPADGGIPRDAGLGVPAPLGIAIADDGHGKQTFFVSNEQGIARIADGRVDRVDALRFRRSGSTAVEGDEDIGSAYALAALDARTVAFTDPRGHAVRILRFESVADATRLTPPAALASDIAAIAASTWIVAGSGSPTEGAGFADGTAALFDAPAGIALARDGTLVVADAANRRIRVIRDYDRRVPLEGDPIPLPPPRGTRPEYRVVYAGDSAVWWDTSWSTSIPGLLERALAPEVLAESGKTLVVYPVRFVGAGVDALSSYVRTVAETRLVDAVVLQFGDGMLEPTQLGTTNWIAPVAGAVGTLRTDLRADGVALVVGAMPSAIGLWPGEGAWRRLVENSLRPQFADDESSWNEAFRTAGVPSYDLWAAYRSDLSTHEAMVTGDDRHPTPHGRRVIARTIVQALRFAAPWRRRTGG
jgi:hypothetical protein